jgi:glycogen debranching enzyme
MDAKVDGWVVTPRRGKAVEINALWYNALRLLEQWLREDGEREEAARAWRTPSARARRSTPLLVRRGRLPVRRGGRRGRRRPACRPNQVFAISLRSPGARRGSAGSRCSTSCRSGCSRPSGLRSLAPRHPDYKPRYYGRPARARRGLPPGHRVGLADRPVRRRVAALPPGRPRGARALLEGFVAHLDEAASARISEIFDAEPPFTPRGCIAQAWSVAEVLRCIGLRLAAEGHAVDADEDDDEDEEDDEDEAAARELEDAVRFGPHRSDPTYYDEDEEDDEEKD